MTHILAALWLSAGLIAVPAAAETPASPALAAPEVSGPGGAEPADPKLERQRNSAAKLAGMVRFVDASCTALQPDYDRFKQVIARLGVDLKDLENGELMARSLSYTQTYQKDGPSSCDRAAALFGASGTVLAGLVVPRPASDSLPAGRPPATQAPAGQAPAGQVPAGNTP